MNDSKLTERAKTVSCILALTATLAVRIPTADARSMGAFAGSPLDGSSPTCFAESAGGVTGTGAGGCVGAPLLSSPRWEVGLPIDSTGSWTISIGIRGNGTDGPVCQAFAVDQLTGTISTSGVATNVATAFSVKSVQVPNVSGGGYLYVACWHLVDSNFRVGSINWNQP